MRNKQASLWEEMSSLVFTTKNKPRWFTDISQLNHPI